MLRPEIFFTVGPGLPTTCKYIGIAVDQAFLEPTAYMTLLLEPVKRKPLECVWITILWRIYGRKVPDTE